ncbi:MAG: hypothetical protein QM811_10375 [Pirellulales bacterium]
MRRSSPSFKIRRRDALRPEKCAAIKNITLRIAIFVVAPYSPIKLANARNTPRPKHPHFTNIQSCALVSLISSATISGVSAILGFAAGGSRGG